MSTRPVVALLGRPPNVPADVDAIESYCRFLGEALTRQGWPTSVVNVRWDTMGWLRALGQLWQQSGAWRGRWVLVQYTALHWSWRGLPLPFLALLYLLRRRGARVGIVFHDPVGHVGRRFRHRLRRAWQHRVMRVAYGFAHRSIHTIPVDTVPWLPRHPRKAVSIPVGSMIPTLDTRIARARRAGERRGDKTVAVFCLRAGERTEAEEVSDIAYAVRRAAERVPRLHLLVIGLSSEGVEDQLRRALTAGPTVDVCATGVLPAEAISRQLIAADALLFVRGAISAGRSSAVAAIGCGLPIVAYAGPPTGHPITEAGVILVGPGDRAALARELTRVLTDISVWSDLHQRNLVALDRYFSWDAIAARFTAALAA